MVLRAPSIAFELPADVIKRIPPTIMNITATMPDKKLAIEIMFPRIVGIPPWASLKLFPDASNKFADVFTLLNTLLIISIMAREESKSTSPVTTLSTLSLADFTAFSLPAEADI
jgi:hypothetical protein